MLRCGVVPRCGFLCSTLLIVGVIPSPIFAYLSWACAVSRSGGEEQAEIRKPARKRNSRYHFIFMVRFSNGATLVSTFNSRRFAEVSGKPVAPLVGKSGFRRINISGLTFCSPRTTKAVLVNSNLAAESVDTHNKALKVNLDPRWYGTFAEIGAGQEVVRWFFRVGGAAGTIAKSISAYDMKVSDAIYGRSERYVSKGSLQAMLDRELELNIERLGEPAATPPRSSPSPTPWSRAASRAATSATAGWA